MSLTPFRQVLMGLAGVAVLVVGVAVVKYRPMPPAVALDVSGVGAAEPIRASANHPDLGGRPAQVSQLLTQWSVLNSACRGGAGNEPATDQACRERDVVGSALERAGMCYGEPGQAGYEMTWHNCPAEPASAPIQARERAAQAATPHRVDDGDLMIPERLSGDFWRLETGHLRGSLVPLCVPADDPTVVAARAKSQGRLYSREYNDVDGYIFRQEMMLEPDGSFGVIYISVSDYDYCMRAYGHSYMVAQGRLALALKSLQPRVDAPPEPSEAKLQLAPAVVVGER